jgi:hypothetical protein
MGIKERIKQKLEEAAGGVNPEHKRMAAQAGINNFNGRWESTNDNDHRGVEFSDLLMKAGYKRKEIAPSTFSYTKGSSSITVKWQRQFMTVYAIYDSK